MEVWYRADLDLIEIKEFLIKKETASKVIEHDGVIWSKVSPNWVFAKTKEDAKKHLIEQLSYKMDYHIKMTNDYLIKRSKAEKL